jgi:hypothetical protein
LGGGMLQGLGKEWMIISQKRQSIDWRAYAQSVLSLCKMLL